MEIIRKLFEYIANEYHTAVLAGETLKFFASVIGIVMGVLGIPAAVTAFIKFWLKPFVTLLAPKKKMEELERELKNRVDFDVAWNKEMLRECLQKIFMIVDERHYSKKLKIAIKSYQMAKIGHVLFASQIPKGTDNYSLVDIDYDVCIGYFDDALEYFRKGFKNKPMNSMYKWIYMEIYLWRIKFLWSKGERDISFKECEQLMIKLNGISKREFLTFSEYYIIIAFFWAAKYETIFYNIDGKHSRDHEKISAYEALEAEIRTNTLTCRFIAAIESNNQKRADFLLRHVDEDIRTNLVDVLFTLISCRVELHSLSPFYYESNSILELLRNVREFDELYQLFTDEQIDDLALIEAVFRYYQYLQHKEKRFIQDSCDLLGKLLEPRFGRKLSRAQKVKCYGYYGLSLQERGDKREANKYLQQAFELSQNCYGENTIFWSDKLPAHMKSAPKTSLLL